MRFKSLAITAACGMTAAIAAPTPAQAQAESFIGQVTAFPYTFCPRGWAEADGRLLEIRTNTALFSLLGTNYGGDGRTTFGLPDLRGKLSMGNGNKSVDLKYCIALQGIFPSRN